MCFTNKKFKQNNKTLVNIDPLPLPQNINKLKEKINQKKKGKRKNG